MSFSGRNGFSAKSHKEVYDGTPEGLRFFYWKRVLKPIVYIDNDPRYPQKAGNYIGCKALLEELAADSGTMPPEGHDDSWQCEGIVEKTTLESEWYIFYDVVERVALTLLALCEEKPQFENYRAQTNRLFSNFCVGWRIDIDGVLRRDLAEEIRVVQSRVEAQLEGQYAAAGVHLQKAKRFLRERPVDGENAIKEIMTALESVGRTQYPRTSTLGEACRAMRQNGSIPPMLVTIIEKFYAYGSAESGVRHGAATPPNVLIEEADLCFSIGLSIMKYMLASESLPASTAEQPNE